MVFNFLTFFFLINHCSVIMITESTCSHSAAADRHGNRDQGIHTAGAAVAEVIAIFHSFSQ